MPNLAVTTARRDDTAIVALWTSKPTNVIGCIRPVSYA
jgi:hypothetical protein